MSVYLYRVPGGILVSLTTMVAGMEHLSSAVEDVARIIVGCGHSGTVHSSLDTALETLEVAVQVQHIHTDMRTYG